MRTRKQYEQQQAIRVPGVSANFAFLATYHDKPEAGNLLAVGLGRKASKASGAAVASKLAAWVTTSCAPCSRAALGGLKTLLHSELLRL